MSYSVGTTAKLSVLQHVETCLPECEGTREESNQQRLPIFIPNELEREGGRGHVTVKDSKSVSAPQK